MKKLVESLGILKESHKIEFKLAKNSFPKEALNTYSAFANTDGGILVLGIEEKSGRAIVSGVENIEKIKKDIFDTLNNKSIVSKNIIDDRNVKIEEIESKKIIIIEIPKANYKDKPVYLRGQLNLAYKRNHEGDYKCTEDEIKQMIRDSSDDPLDNQVVSKFSMNDLDKETINLYRKNFINLKPDHIFNKLELEEFLIKLRVLRRNRDNKELEPTLAGILFFGKTEVIKEVLPYFHLEYIDKSIITQERWEDRVIYDGTWGEGNLYNFFNIVIRKLYLSVEKNFQISKDLRTREEYSSIQIALREMLVNAIIHADYKIDNPLKIVKYSNYFEFQNPGGLKISKMEFFNGGFSKPRNENIEFLFRMINLCERAGTGIPKILKVTHERKFKFPEIEDDGKKFIFKFWNTSFIDELQLDNEKQRLIIEYVVKNLKITNSEARENLSLKKHEAAELFNKLIEKGYLERNGIGRGIYYTLKCSEEEAKTRLIGQVSYLVEKLKEIL
ncbi:RNA-binding domain-containing protein [uncultured Fusobacterium sp.]|uniref:RNA-binding domain-containing protein n=1 Tax=uncultured Fusobacterium sp. TaxID=159267 RepID=UPI0025DE023B|nr:RNA-binding domain-containing protein [uncultured Fusobacterium sp.]